MATWLYFIHPPREDFAETMTEAEGEAWARHWVRIQRLFVEGRDQHRHLRVRGA